MIRFSISKKQTKANKRNALRSTGPRSVTGKQRLSENALKHSLNVPFDEVSDLRFDRLSKYLLEDGYSSDKAQELAAAIFNHRRVMENVAHAL